MGGYISARGRILLGYWVFLEVLKVKSWVIAKWVSIVTLIIFLICLFIFASCSLRIRTGPQGEAEKPAPKPNCTYTVITPGPVYQCKTLDDVYSCGMYLKDCWTNPAPSDVIKGTEIHCANNVIVECK